MSWGSIAAPVSGENTALRFNSGGGDHKSTEGQMPCRVCYGDEQETWDHVKGAGGGGRKGKQEESSGGPAAPEQGCWGGGPPSRILVDPGLPSSQLCLMFPQLGTLP